MTEATSGRTRPVWIVIAFALTICGAVSSAYLLMRHFALVSGQPERFDLCKAIYGGNCDEAIRSGMGDQLGIPLAGWGLVHFIVVAVMLLLANFLGKTFRIEGTVAAFFLCLASTVVGAVLTSKMFTGAAAFCPFCLAVHTVNLLLIPVIVLASGQTLRELLSAFVQGIKYVFGARVDDPVLARWKVSGFVIAGLAGVVAYQWVLIQSDRWTLKSKQTPTFNQALAEFEKKEKQEIPVGEVDPWFGDQNAPMRVVVFSDFQCPACAGFAHTLEHLRNEHPALSVVFKHYPLSSQCNSEVKVDMHPLSCGAAGAAEAARRQGKFWEYHDALFESKEQLDGPTLRKLATEIGLDMAQFEMDAAAETTTSKVAADVALGNQLKVGGTPTVFLNGKLLAGSERMFLEELIMHESDHKGKRK